MSQPPGRILFRLQGDELVVANTGRPFTLRGLVAIVYGWTSTKAGDSETEREQDREFVDEAEARSEVTRLHRQKQTALGIEDQRRSEANQQAQMAQSYAGRALIELLQNAVDANRARPIGYKGIGFRSILTLSNSPQIRSGPLRVRWSPEIASCALGGAALPDSSVLAFPEWCDEICNDLSSYTTVVRLLLSPEGQVNFTQEWEAITGDPSLITFIDGIEEVRWESNDVSRRWNRKREDDIVCVTETVGESDGTPLRWCLHVSKDENATVGVPINADGTLRRSTSSQQANLRCFFPTDDPNPFPNVLVHARFPLAPDRKRIDLKHGEATGRIAAVAEAMGSAVADRSEADLLDIVEHIELAPAHAARVEARLCENVLRVLRGHPISQRRSCPAFDQLPLSWRNQSRLDSWEKFKAVLSEYRRERLAGLPLLPVGVENRVREATLLWVNPAAALKADDLRKLRWAPVEGGTVADSDSLPIFESPDDGDELPKIPAGIDLHFLSRAFSKSLSEQLKANVASDLLRLMFGVRQFRLIEVVESAVLPALRRNQQAPDLIGFLFGLWCHRRDSDGKPFDWDDVRRAELIGSCKVVCDDSVDRPVVQVYAGNEWTGSTFLEGAYRSRSDRAFLHSPPPDESERSAMAGFYRWLGVGWFPKVLPLVAEAKEPGTRRGLSWRNGRFAGLTVEPNGWAEYCATAWDARFASSRFLSRTPRLRTNWTLDGGADLLACPGAFDAIRLGWAEYSRYALAVCCWSGNLSQDYDNESHVSDSYLIWLLKTMKWIPTEKAGRRCAPCDSFLPGEVAQSRNIRGWVQDLKLDVPAEMASKLGMRRNWSEIEHADWVRWLTLASKLKPQENVEEREQIRRLYACLLDRAQAAANNVAPFAGTKFWWIERLPGCEHWKFESVGTARGSYLDRPEFDLLFLRGVFIFPVRLDGKESKAASLIRVPLLSTRLKGVPAISGERNVDELHDLLFERATYLVAYLGMERNEQGREKLRSAVSSVRVSDVDDLIVRWTLDGNLIDGGDSMRDSFVSSGEVEWRVYLRSKQRVRDPKWAVECIAEAVLLACGFRPTERVANVCDILMCDEARIREKLTKLGVAPETVDDELRRAVVPPTPPAEPPVPPAEPPVPPAEPPVPPAETPVPPAEPPVPPAEPPVPPAETPVPPAETPVPPAEPPTPPPLPPQRPHVEAFNAQKWLRSELENRLMGAGWQIGEEIPVGPSRIDIVLRRLHGRHLIEVKQIERGTVYWREEQIKAAQLHPTEYVIALVTSPEKDVHEVRWVWSPLMEFEQLDRRLSWYWKEHPASGGLNEHWQPVAARPARHPDAFKAVIQLPPAFLAKLETGIEALVKRISSNGGLT